jgi:hypothetical protein
MRRQTRAADKGQLRNPIRIARGDPCKNPSTQRGASENCLVHIHEVKKTQSLINVAINLVEPVRLGRISMSNQIKRQHTVPLGVLCDVIAKRFDVPANPVKEHNGAISLASLYHSCAVTADIHPAMRKGGAVHCIPKTHNLNPFRLQPVLAVMFSVVALHPISTL